MSSFNLVVPVPVRKVRIVSKNEIETKAPDVDSYGEGFDAGYKAGLMQAEYEAKLRRKQEAARIEEELRKLRGALEEIGEVHHELDRVVSSHLPQLVLAALSRVFQHHKFDIEEIAAEVKSLLKELALAKSISIECAPDSIKKLQQFIGKDGATFCQAGIEWIPNPELKAGEYMLKSDLGVLDGRHITRMAHVQTAMKAIL